jgi:hypothetical protein
MKLCPDCGQPLHKKHFCRVAARRSARIGEITTTRPAVIAAPSPSDTTPSPMAKAMAKSVAKDMGHDHSPSSTYRYRNRERRRSYMRAYMRGYGCRWCRLPEGYFERGSDCLSPDHKG